VSTWILVWFVVALVSTVALLACAIAMVRHVILVGRTARQMQEETQPIIEDLTREGRRASQHASALRPPTRAKRS
jgi:hypothetical protein